MGDKEDKTDSKNGSYSDSLEIFDNIFSEGKATDVPDTKKGHPGPTAPKQAQKPGQRPAPPVKAASTVPVKKIEQGTVPQKTPPVKKAQPAQSSKAAPQGVQAKPKEKQPASDNKDGSYSESLKIPEDIFKKGTGDDAPSTKKGPTAAATTVKKPEQSPASQQVPPAKKPAPPAQPSKAAPPVDHAKTEEKQPDAEPEDESYSESQELFDTIFSQSVDAASSEAKKGPPRPPAQPVKAAAPKQFQKAEQKPASPFKPASIEQVRKLEQRPVPPIVTPAKEAVPSAHIVKSGRSFEADTYMDKSPDRDKGSGKEKNKMEIYEEPKKSLNPFIIVSSIIVLIILAMLTGMFIENRSGIIGGIKTTRNARPEKEAPAKTDKDKDFETSTVIDKKSEIKEHEIQASQQSKEEVPLKIDKAPSTVPAEVTDKVVASEELISSSYPYSIYLGSYNTDEAVKKAKSDYEEMGLSPYWVKADLGEKGIWFRLYANYFQTREETDKVIETKQLSGTESKKTNYVNLIGIYSSEKEVSSQKEIIEKLGYSPYIITDNINSFRLYVGAFYQRDMAEEQNAELLQKGIQSKVVER